MFLRGAAVRWVWGVEKGGVSVADHFKRPAIMLKTPAALIAAVLTLNGCGTVSTVLREEAAAKSDLRKMKTYCQSIPRIYSGVAFDFCALHAAPDPTGILIPFVLVDIVMSGVADTVVLPYTIYRQAVDGNLSIYWQPNRS
jgi:uncharacterized protein YceK